MSKRADGLHADFLDNRWSVTDSKNGTTLVASVSAPQSAKEERNLDFLNFTIANMNAAAFTVTAAVRDVSFAGTILAQWALIVPGSTTAQVNADMMGLKGTRGAGMHFTTNTVLGSVVASVNAFGWTNQSENS